MRIFPAPGVEGLVVRLARRARFYGGRKGRSAKRQLAERGWRYTRRADGCEVDIGGFALRLSLVST